MKRDAEMMTNVEFEIAMDEVCHGGFAVRNDAAFRLAKEILRLRAENRRLVEATKKAATIMADAGLDLPAQVLRGALEGGSGC